MNIQHIIVQVLVIFDTCMMYIYIQAVQSAAYSYYIHQSYLESISRSKFGTVGLTTDRFADTLVRRITAAVAYPYVVV